MCIRDRSTMFDIYIEYLKKQGVQDNQIIKINIENPEITFNNYMELYNYVKERLNKEKKTYVFIDEVQNIDDFQKAIDGLYINKNIDLYLTGSNAYLLSGELATLISGRYIAVSYTHLNNR